MRVTRRKVELAGSASVERRRKWTIVPVAALILSMVACSDSQQREAERQAAEARKQADTAVEKARESAGDAAKEASKAAQGAAETAKEAASKLGAQAKDAALEGASAAAAIGSQAAVSAGRATENASVRAAGALRTGAIRAALLRNESLDVSDVDVNTDEATKRVVLLGRVKSAVEKATVERIAREKAPGYTVENRLTVRG